MAAAPRKKRQGPEAARKSLSAAPPELRGLELDARRAERLRTVEVLKCSRTPLTVLEVAAGATVLAEEMVASAAARSRPPPLACKEGCDWCCYLKVGTAAPEVFRIVAYLRETLPAAEFQALRERVIAADNERRAPKSGGRRTQPRPCPLLVDHRCAAYPVRPLTCRGFNSRDARRCELSLDPEKHVSVPVYAAQLCLTTFILDGMRAGLEESGVKGDLLELTGALRIALEEPEVLERWLAGQAVFAPARMV